MDLDAPVMMAYIGLGAGLGPAGCLLAVGSAVLLILVGFTLYPAREILRRWRWWRNRARGGGGGGGGTKEEAVAGGEER